MTLIVVALCGAVALWYATPWGIGTSPDSANYITAARSLLAGHGLSVVGVDGKLKPMTHWPPFYPILLATLGLFGTDSLDAARALNAFLFPANILMVGLLAYVYTGRSGWAAVLCSFFMLCSPTMLHIHSMAWSEPAFISLCLVALFLMGRYTANPTLPILIGFSAATAVALLTRYVGVALVATGLVAIAFFRPRLAGHKLRDLTIFAMLSCGPMGLWIVRNLSFANTAADRSIKLYRIDFSRLWSGVDVFSFWLLPTSAPGILRYLVVTAVVAGLLIAEIKSRQRPDRSLHSLMAFALIYVAVILITMLSFDPRVQLNERILSPIFPIGLIVLMQTIYRVIRRSGPAASFRIASVVFAVAFASWHATRGTTWLIATRRDGLGFSKQAWVQSETIQQVRMLPEGTRIYSNARAPIWLYTRRTASSIPKGGDENSSLQWTEMRENLKNRNSVVVWFRPGTQKDIVSETDLVQRFELIPVQTANDGTIYSRQQ